MLRCNETAIVCHVLLILLSVYDWRTCAWAVFDLCVGRFRHSRGRFGFGLFWSFPKLCMLIMNIMNILCMNISDRRSAAGRRSLVLATNRNDGMLRLKASRHDDDGDACLGLRHIANYSCKNFFPWDLTLSHNRPTFVTDDRQTTIVP